MVRHFRGSLWNHFELRWPHHWYSHTGRIYRADHKTWFGVGLTFVIFSCVAFSVNYYAPKESELKGFSRARRYTQVFLCCLNPFSPALVKLQTFIFYLKTFKKLWRGEKIKPSDTGRAVNEEAYAILASNDIPVLYEAILESAPQFIIQLYAMVAQQKSVKVVQTVSLPVSFLCLLGVYSRGCCHSRQGRRWHCKLYGAWDK